MQCCAVRSCLQPREGCQSDVTKTSLVVKIFLSARFSSHFPPSANSLFRTLLIASHFLHLCNLAASYTRSIFRRWNRCTHALRIIRVGKGGRKERGEVKIVR